MTELERLLKTEEQRANRGFLIFLLVAEGLLELVALVVVLILNKFGANIATPPMDTAHLYLLMSAFVITSIPTAMHLFRFQEDKIKWIMASLFPLSQALGVYVNFNINPPLAIWFMGLYPAIYYLNPWVALQTWVSTAILMLVTTHLAAPDYALAELATPIICMGFVCFASFLASKRYRRVSTVLDEAAIRERESANAMHDTLTRMQEGADVVHSAVRSLDVQSHRVRSSVHDTVSPVVVMMKEGIDKQIESLADGSQAIAVIHTSIQDVSAGAMQQARSVTDAMGTVSAMTQSSEDMVRFADAVSSDAEHTFQLVTDGQKVVAENRNASVAVEQTAQETAFKLTELGKHAQKIGQVIDLIHELQEQMSMLSLNASVEAARAGSHGKGFNVVAQEIRSLANRAADSSQDIAKMVGLVEDGLRQSLVAMGRTTDSATFSLERSGQMERVLENVFNASNRTATQVRSIHERIALMNEHAGSLSGQMTELAAMAQENAASAEEMTLAAEKLVAVSGAIERVGKETQELVGGVEAAVTEVVDVVNALHTTSEHLNTAAERLNQ